MRKSLCAVAVSAGSLLACGGSVDGANGVDGGIGSGDDGGGSSCGAFNATLRTGDIDKVDLLFMIDNSASMGDKDVYLRQAIPDLVGRLVQPNCIAGGAVVGRTDASGACASGTPEFQPIHDMHIGIVTSALGSRLGDVCDPLQKADQGPLLAHNDDRGHLVNRAGDDEHALVDAQPSNFLEWFPDVPQNAGKSPGSGAVPIKQVSQLQSEFSDMVSGVHALGCGIESQLESWYRFLIQPDPYDSIANVAGHAAWVGVDAALIAQRHDFLRPDSAVAIITLSDENDSEIDVRTLGQQGFNWMSTGFNPPKGVSVCDQNPADPDCTSCLLAPNGGAGDPNCASAYTAENDWG